MKTLFSILYFTTLTISLICLCYLEIKPNYLIYLVMFLIVLFPFISFRLLLPIFVKNDKDIKEYEFSEDEIRNKAYEIYIRTGNENESENWNKAIEELTNNKEFNNF